jgi:hypothetical protein
MPGLNLENVFGSQREIDVISARVNKNRTRASKLLQDESFSSEKAGA